MKRVVLFLFAVVSLATTLLLSAEVPGHSRDARADSLQGIHKIRHVVIIMQENRSFDSYFGTYPGADGIPGLAGNPGRLPCLPDPQKHHCVGPYHDSSALNAGGPHGHGNALGDIAAGKMTGFVVQAQRGKARACKHVDSPYCSQHPRRPDVMGYHDWREIPNYWDYASHFVLQDHMFESDASWSLPAHLYMVSGWSALCTRKGDPMSCRSAVQEPGSPPGTPGNTTGKPPDYAWTDLTWLLHRYGVSWGYYVHQGGQPDCADNQMFCAPVPQHSWTPGIWNPLPWFDTVREDNQLGSVRPLRDFFTALDDGGLPAVSWLVPSQAVSDHPTASIIDGQAYVTGVINSIMRSSAWDSTAIFLAWDDWGGFYDHQVLSFDAYLKFIEDDFLHGQRIDPRTDGRPDPRPDVRENEKILGNLAKDFNFDQKPRPPLILPLYPPYS